MAQDCCCELNRLEAKKYHFTIWYCSNIYCHSHIVFKEFDSLNYKTSWQFYRSFLGGALHHTFRLMKQEWTTLRVDSSNCHERWSDKTTCQHLTRTNAYSDQACRLLFTRVILSAKLRNSSFHRSNFNLLCKRCVDRQGWSPVLVCYQTAYLK